jgi:hypothetical protein
MFFSLLARHLRSLWDNRGAPLCHVAAKDRIQNSAGDDIDLESLAAGTYPYMRQVCSEVLGRTLRHNILKASVAAPAPSELSHHRRGDTHASCLHRFGTV